MTGPYLADLETQVLVHGRTGESSSAPIFDAAAEGLRFFDTFGPLYARHRGISFDFERDIRVPFDAQREIAFAKLHADADDLRGLQRAITEQSLDVRDTAAPIFGAWQGSTADAAREGFDTLFSSAGSAWAKIAHLADAIDAAVDAAERIVVEKVRAVSALALTTIAGVDAAQTRFLLDCAARVDVLSDSDLVELGRLCGLSVNPQVCRTGRNLLSHVGKDITGWLDHVFIPVYEARMAAFSAACTAAEAALDEAWNGLRCVLQQLGEQRITAPGTANDNTSTAAAMSPIVSTVESPAGGGPARVSGPAPVAEPPAAVVTVGGAPPQQPSQREQQDDRDKPDRPGEHIATSVEDPAAVGITDMMGMRPAPTGPVAAAPAAAHGFVGGTTGYGYGYPLTAFAGAAGQGGGASEHRRSVPLHSSVIPDSADAKAPPRVLGGEDDPTEYHEESLEAEPQPVEAEEEQPEEELEEFWELGEDGELQCLTRPKK